MLDAHATGQEIEGAARTPVADEGNLLVDPFALPDICLDDLHGGTQR